MKNIITNLFVLIFSVQLSFGCKSSNIVTISAKVINVNDSTPGVFKVNFLNPFNNVSKSAQLDRNGEFSIKGEMMFPQNITIQYNNTFINLYVGGGDSVHMDIDASALHKDNFEWLSFKGDNAKINDQLNKCNIFLSSIPVAKYNYSLAPESIIKLVKKDYQRQLTLLEKYSSENRIDSMVVRWARKTITYNISNWISDYASVDSGTFLERKARIQLFNDPFFDMYNSSNFQTMMYPYHLGNYVDALTRLDPAISRYLNNGEALEAARSALTLLSEEPRGVSRDYMVYSFLTSLSKKYPVFRLDSLAGLPKYFSDTIYYNQLSISVNAAKNNRFKFMLINGISNLNSEGIVNLLPGIDMFDYLKKRYPGKVIYIDVYATWCVPCIREMKYAPQVHQAFKDKDVVFVNLCLQSTQTNWIKLIKKENIKGDNFYFNDDATKLFMGTYNLSGFPKYILVSKKGEISTLYAPKPSEMSRLTNVINDLLEK